jgi:aryl carrier-like protein
MARKTVPEKRALYTGLQKGVRTRWKTRGPLRLAGVDYTMQDIDDILQQLLDSIRAVELAEGALHGAVSKRSELELKYRRLVNWVVDLAQTQYGNDTAELAAFALRPAGVPGPKTTEAKAASAAKAVQTRKQRGTMGPQQRKKLKAR